MSYLAALPRDVLPFGLTMIGATIGKIKREFAGNKTGGENESLFFFFDEIEP